MDHYISSRSVVVKRHGARRTRESFFALIAAIGALSGGAVCFAQFSTTDVVDRIAVTTAPADESVEELARRIAERPDDVVAVVRLIAANIALDRLEMADQLIQASEQRLAGHAEFEAVAAIADERRERWLSVVTRVLRLENSAGEADTLRLVRAFRKLGRGSEADERLRAALDRNAASIALWCAWIDAAMDDNRPAAALERYRGARKLGRTDPRLTYRAARATAKLEHGFGKAEVRQLTNARPGQFVDGWLVLEATAQPGRFLCAPPNSAIALAREALDSGLDEPECLLVHAEIWHRAGRFNAAREILKSRPDDYWRRLDDEGLQLVSKFLFDAGDVNAAIGWSKLRVERTPAARGEILAAAFIRAAEVFNQRGDANLHRDYLRRAAELRPSDDALKLRLADADWSAGDRARAVQAYRSLIDKRPPAEAEVRILERLAEWQTSQAGNERR